MLVPDESRYEPDGPRVAVTALVADTARIGVPGRRLWEGAWELDGRRTEIGPRCEIRDHCVVGEESVIGADTVLDCYSWVDVGTTIGAGVLLTHRASLGARVVVGDHCVIAGLVCEGSRVGVGCRVFGDLVHRQLDPTKPWDAPESQEIAPSLEDRVFVGWGATIVGEVTVGAGGYVCAGAVVTRDVKPGMIVAGVNEVCHPDDWRGPLGESDFFRR